MIVHQSLVSLSALLLLLLLFPVATTAIIQLDFETNVPPADGPANLAEGKRLLEQLEYDKAAMHYWRAVLTQAQYQQDYSVEECFNPFIQCFALQGKMVDGFVFVAQESIARGQVDMGKRYLEQALDYDPNHVEAQLLQQHLDDMGMGGSASGQQQQQQDVRTSSSSSDDFDMEGTPEQLYEVASQYFTDRDYENCADVFEISCLKSGVKLGPSCANAVYCRTMICDWGFNGTQFEKDMRRITDIATRETLQFRVEKDDGTVAWRRSTSPHPHMMLGYPVDSMLKRYMAESSAFMEELATRVENTGTITPLPDDLPFDQKKDLEQHVIDASKPGFKIRVGFVSSGFNSKAVLYLSHDMFRFFDKEQFEIHIFSMGPADNPMFIKHGMRGVDWRERVKANVDYFHDVQHLQSNHIELARFIHSKGIHILQEWDGYARQGERAQGTFALRPAPIQMWHQEYLGTSGSEHVDYLFTDKISSPEHLQNLYMEKLIYLPNHFFSKGHAVQAEVKTPTYDYPVEKKVPYEVGSGSPQTNRCMAPDGQGPEVPSIVFCNYNKFLKNNPETVRSWIRILRQVPDSMLCLLENPPTGVVYLKKFIHEAAGTSENNGEESTFVAGDGDELLSRIHFLPWERNPFDHQMRSQDFCNVMLDSYPYNGHTTAQDSLYGGVPIVTRSDGDDMCSRVTTSANIVLGMEELNAYEGPRQYEDIAIEFGNNPAKLKAVRDRLIASALQRNPMHPYWDVARYVKNFQVGLKAAWERYLSGQPPDHITVEETDDAKRGTYDKELLANPPEGKPKGGASDEL